MDHYDSQLIIKRNKKIDEFVNKSTRVSEQVGKGPNVFVLEFVLDGKQVYSIQYD